MDEVGAPAAVRSGRSSGRVPRFLAGLVRVLVVTGLVLAAALAGVLLLLPTMNPTGGGGSEPDWQDWCVRAGPAAAAASGYQAGAPVMSNVGDTVDEVSVTWRTRSRTAAQACADFRAGMAAALGGRGEPVEVQQEPDDPTAGCTLTADWGRVTALVSPSPPGQASGVSVTVVERRP